MRSLACAAMFCLSAAVGSQTIAPPEQRPVSTFAVRNTFRLDALARLGFLTHTSILVEADTLPYLQAPISLSAQNSTVFAVATEILRGLEPYSIRQDGPLLIVVSTHARSRILTLPLGPFTYTGNSLAMLTAYLSAEVSAATGCAPRGYAIGGGSLDLALPRMELSSPTFEQVVAEAAKAPEPSMWVVAPDPTPTPCIDDPSAHWQVGLYGFGSGFSSCNQPLRSWIGPAFAAPPNPSPSSDESCKQPRLPSPVPSTSPPAAP